MLCLPFLGIAGVGKDEVGVCNGPGRRCRGNVYWRRHHDSRPWYLAFGATRFHIGRFARIQVRQRAVAVNIGAGIRPSVRVLACLQIGSDRPDQWLIGYDAPPGSRIECRRQLWHRHGYDIVEPLEKLRWNELGRVLKA